MYHFWFHLNASSGNKFHSKKHRLTDTHRHSNNKKKEFSSGSHKFYHAAARAYYVNQLLFSLIIITTRSLCERRPSKQQKRKLNRAKSRGDNWKVHENQLKFDVLCVLLRRVHSRVIICAADLSASHRFIILTLHFFCFSRTSILRFTLMLSIYSISCALLHSMFMQLI